MSESGLKERLSHVHRHRLDPRLLIRGERGIKRVQRLGFPSFPPRIRSFLPAGRRLASYTGVPWQWPSRRPRSPKGVFLLSSQFSLYGPLLDSPGFVPTDPEKGRRTRHITGLQNINGQPFKHLGEAAPGFGPGHQHLSDSVSRTGDAGNPGMKVSEELAAVQVSPDPLYNAPQNLDSVIRLNPT